MLVGEVRSLVDEESEPNPRIQVVFPSPKRNYNIP